MKLNSVRVTFGNIKSYTVYVQENSNIIELLAEAGSTGARRERSCTELHRIYNGKLISYSSFLLKKNYQSEEVQLLVQNTWIKIFTHLHQYNSQYFFIIWAKSILRNNFLDDCRRNKTNRKYILEDIDECRQAHRISDNSQSPDRRMINAECEKKISQFIEQCNPLHKQVLELRAEGNSYEQIKLQTGIPSGTVSSILCRSKTLLKNKFLR